ncbi:MAG: type II toxin-antitoxin system RelE/ParE family toxin [Planctomycetes bacterium]|nr:type II toxin-antitoxin system RelE/ParE family toxin [Planctomycetota bacterium]
MKVRFTVAAAAEFVAACQWYEQERTGLGGQLFDATSRLLEGIVEHPLRYRIVRRSLRRALVTRFPYAVYYRVLDGAVVVEGFLHGSRDPAIWQVRDS